jgi:tripartite-type tricarboxylate transporter receptor subunit TctC
MIVPFAAGGPTDVIARIVADSMSKTLGQQIVVENVAGAGGTTGTTRAAQSAPDGYTIMMGHMGTHGAAPALYPNLKYDPTKDFEPIGMAAGTPILIVAKKNFPAKDLKEFLAKAKADGDKINEAHAGIGSVSHTTCLLLNAQAGLKPTQVPFRGTGPALNDLVSGQATSRRMRLRHLSARRPCQTCQPRRKRVFPNIRLARGTPFSRRRVRRKTSRRSLTMRSAKR